VWKRIGPGHASSPRRTWRFRLARALARSVEQWDAVTANAAEAPLDALLDNYLSGRHRDSTGEGCIYAALAADVARQDNPALRRRFTEVCVPRSTSWPGWSLVARKRCDASRRWPGWRA
jgi:hypothetical protein